MSHTVRAANAADVPALLALVRRYWEFEGLTDFQALRIETLLQRLIAEPARGAVFIATSAAAPVGYLVLVYVLSLEHGGLMGEIDELYVEPAARAQGSGAALLAAAEAELRARRGVRLQLQLAAGNAAARSFYERRGFRSRAGFALFDKPL